MSLEDVQKPIAEAKEIFRQLKEAASQEKLYVTIYFNAFRCPRLIM